MKVVPPRSGEEFTSSAVRLSGFAAVTLGWSPDVFWRATPAELGAVVGVIAGDAPQPMGARDVAALMEVFPDG